MKIHQTRNSVPAYKFPNYVLLHRITDCLTNNDAEVEKLINIPDENWTSENEDQAYEIITPIKTDCTNREQFRIIFRYFGLVAGEERMECPAISKELGMTVCQVRKTLDEGIKILRKYIAVREKLKVEYWEKNPPQPKKYDSFISSKSNDIYEICQIDPETARIPISRLGLEKATVNRLFQMDVLFLGDLITKTEEDIFGHHHRCDKQTRVLKDDLASYKLHLSWNIEDKDDKIESNHERHMAIRKFAKRFGESEEDVWRRIVCAANLLRISNDEVANVITKIT